MRRILLAATILALGGVAAWWALSPREVAPPPVPELAAPPPPAPLPAMVPAEVPGGAGAVLPVAAPDSRSIGEDGLKAAQGLAEKAGSTALLVWHRGALQLEWYAPQVRPFDRLPGGGLEDALMVMLTGQALKTGLLPSIDTSVATWLPEWKDGPRARVTVRHLLEGSSGLDAPAEPPGPDAAAWTLSAPLAAEPGTRFQPSAFETQVLGLVLSRAAGKPLPAYLGEGLWQPLGARPATLMADGKGTGAYVHCCVEAAARDWLRLGLLVLDRGEAGGAGLIPVHWLDEMLRPVPFSRHDGWRVRFGWPFERQGTVQAKEAFADGDTVFWQGREGARLTVSRGQELVVLRLGPPVADWDESRLANLLSRAVTTPPPDNRKIMSRGSSTELPPITKPPPVPKVETVPLDPLPANQ